MLITVLFLLFLPGLTGAQNRSLDAVMPDLSQHIRTNMDAQPGFVCDEKMTWAGHITESEYRPVRHDSPLGYQIVESRQVQTIDGKVVGKGVSYEVPRSNGVVASLAGMILPDNYLFSIHGTEFVSNTSTVILEFETKPDVSERSRVYTSGKAWVDPKSVQILRLEDRVRVEGRTIFNSVDYTSIEIDHKTVWVPKTAKSEVLEGNKIINGFPGDYSAEYRNCRKAD